MPTVKIPTDDRDFTLDHDDLEERDWAEERREASRAAKGCVWGVILGAAAWGLIVAVAWAAARWL